jgi:1,4-alpha-glucan branching enzyme
MRKSRFVLAVLWVLCGSVSPMSAADGQPAPSNVAGREFPNVHDDSRVTFRVKAPDAQKAQVAPRGDDSGLGRRPYDMQRDSTVVWIVTTPPVRPGFHNYELAVDGVQCNDPNSETFFGSGHSGTLTEFCLWHRMVDFVAFR